MSSPSYLPLQLSDVPPTTSNLVVTFLSASTWIWPPEEEGDPPNVPPNAQRAFRLTWTNPSPNSQTLSSTTIVITADNYFEFFVNGILLHAADPNHAWENPLMFRIPLPEEGSEKVTYAVRAVNGYNNATVPDSVANPAGLRAAIQIDFSTPPASPPIVLYTGAGINWRSSHSFNNGWEQPGFDDEDWEVATRMPFGRWDTMNPPSQMHFATAHPSSTTAPGRQPTPTLTQSTVLVTSITTSIQTSGSGVSATAMVPTGVRGPSSSTTFSGLEPAPTPTDQQSPNGLHNTSQSNTAFLQGELSGVLIGIALCAVLFRAFTSFLSL